MNLSALAVFCLLAASACNAATLLFDFSGSKATGSRETATGSGVITFADGLSQVGLADATSFAFTLTTCICHPDIGLPDPPYYWSESWTALSSLSLTLGPGNLPTNALLLTGAASPTDYNSWGIQTFNGLFFGDNGFALFGPVTFQAAPEPATTALFLLTFLVMSSVAGWRPLRGAVIRVSMSAAR